MNENCTRARGWMGQWADGELSPAQTAWIQDHWPACSSCRAARDRFETLDRRLLAFGETIGGAEANHPRFLDAIDRKEHGSRRLFPLFPAAVLALAAAAALLFAFAKPLSHRAPVAEDDFIPVPYTAPIASYERASVVSMEIPIATLLSEGYRIGGDPSAMLQADVLVGEDGRMHAVRIPTDLLTKPRAF